MPVAVRARTPKSPQSDPKFQKVISRLNQGSARLRQHPPAAKKATEAQAAALAPPKEKLVGAQAKQVDKMKDAKAGKPDPNSFLAMLRAEIEKVMPQNLEGADNFMQGGEKEQMQGAVTGKVNAQKDDATRDVKQSAKQPPDPNSVQGKPVTPLPGEPAPPTPQVNAGEGMPDAKPDAEISQQQNKVDADQKLKEAEVTPVQLKKANDPRFSAVLDAKTKVEKTADAAPGKYRATEKGVLALAVNAASGDSKRGVAALMGVKHRSGTNVRSRQSAAKERDEKRRKEVTDNIERIYNETKQTVEGKLATLETDVMSAFDSGANSAIEGMKANSRREIEAWKDERYGGVIGKGRWLADLFRPVPQEVKDILARNRQHFTKAMDGLIVRIAGIVDGRLADAKREIDKGQARIKTYVAGLPRDLQQVGKTAQQEVNARFDEMRQGVDDKKNDLANKLAQKYKEASDKADAELKKIEEENAGALRGLIDKLAEIIKILADFKDKLMSLIRKGIATIKLIIADPIGFLSNLISAIKQGIEQFKNNFLKHLQNAFIKWLFGAIEGAGIQLPASLSLPEILKFVLSVLGITYERMRQKAVKLLGPTAVAIIEKVVEYVKALIQGGPAALWEKVKEDLGNLKAMVIDAIIAWVTETIVKQAVMKIVSMFNPAGAIIQAIIAIYNVVMFVIERASQIMTFVEAVINSVHSIATGAIGSAATWIENALANGLVLVISFLARLIGLGGISQKIKEFIHKVQSVVDKAIDKAIGKIVAVVKKLFGKGGGDKAKEKGTVEERWKQGMVAVRKTVAKTPGKLTPIAKHKAELAAIKDRFGFTRLDLVRAGPRWIVNAEMNPKETVDDSEVLDIDTVPFPTDAGDGKKKYFDVSSSGNTRLYCSDDSGGAWHYVIDSENPVKGHWQAIKDRAELKKAEEDARAKLQTDVPGLIEIVKSSKSEYAPGLDVLGIGTRTGESDERLHVGEAKFGGGAGPWYVQFRPKAAEHRPLSATTTGLMGNIERERQRLKSKGELATVQKLDALLKSGKITITYYLRGTVKISNEQIAKVRTYVRRQLGDYLRQKYPKLSAKDISGIIAHVEVVTRNI